MSYTVEWLSRAERELARIWLDAPMRAAVEAAARSIDEQLQRDAMQAGESRSEDEVRVVIVSPLVAEVQVNEEKCR